MPQFKIEKVTARNCDNKIHMGNYSCLVAQFHLKRSISFHLIQNYLPSILIVAVSWVSFWMDIESVPGRISLGVITLLAVSSQASGTNVPQTSYVKVRKEIENIPYGQASTKLPVILLSCHHVIMSPCYN